MSSGSIKIPNPRVHRSVQASFPTGTVGPRVGIFFGPNWTPMMDSIYPAFTKITYYVISHQTAVNHVMNRQIDNLTDIILVQNIKIMSIDLLTATFVTYIYIISVMVRYPWLNISSPLYNILSGRPWKGGGPSIPSPSNYFEKYPISLKLIWQISSKFRRHCVPISLK